LRRAFAGIERWNFRRQPGKIAVAKRRLQMAGGALDGIVAKRLDMDYRSGERMGMQKIKRLRTADCVVGGFRYASQGHAVGSLLLGLYDDEGYLNHVGFASGFPQQGSKALLKKVEPLIEPPGFTGNAPGGPSRWSTNPIQARHQIFALASRQVTEGLFDGAGKAKGSSRCAENFGRSQPGA
jgi:ATP-dependent DNA ligase